MTTVLKLLKSCAYRWNIPFPAAGTLYNNTDPSARQLLELMNATCEELREAACWTQQKKLHTFATESGRSKYALPKDFYKKSPFTEWNVDEERRLLGSLTDSDFTARLYGGFGSSNNFEYRFFGPDSNPNTLGGQFQVYPTPTSVINCSFEYLTVNLYLPKNWEPSTAYTIGQYVNCNGNYYLCDTSGTSGTTPISGTTANITDNTAVWDFSNEPYEEILNDNDMVLFDESLVKLGVRAKWRDEKGEESDRAEAEYNKKIKKAASRLHSPSIMSFTRVGRNSTRYSVPNGGW